MRVRTHAESIAFYQAGQIERKVSDMRLRQVLQKQMSLYNWSFWLNSAVNIFDYVGGIISYLVIAIPIFGGAYDDWPPEDLSALISRVSRELSPEFEFDLKLLNSVVRRPRSCASI